VGSRDEKAGNTHCSKVCCVTGVKQAIELKLLMPQTEIFCFYMDLRMFDRYFEDLYLEAQVKYGINFIRGRLSEAAENMDGSLVLKAEDTLTGRPLRLTVDSMVLLTGITSARNTREVAERLGITLASDRFIKNADNHLNTNLTAQKGIFCCGCSTGARSVAETITDARSAVLKIAEYLS
jgi:heterodisulfide reductase subunit A